MATPAHTTRRSLFAIAGAAALLPAAALATPVQEHLVEPRPWVHEVDTDNMAPALERGRHRLIIHPVKGWSGPGIYLIDTDGALTPYRCERRVGSPCVELHSDNRFYGSHIVDLRWFEDHQRGQARTAIWGLV